MTQSKRIEDEKESKAKQERENRMAHLQIKISRRVYLLRNKLANAFTLDKFDKSNSIVSSFGPGTAAAMDATD
jgi:hypothetical protein